MSQENTPPNASVDSIVHTPTPWNRERTRTLLRFGRKQCGPWDWDERDDPTWREGEIPDDDDVDMVVVAPLAVHALEESTKDLVVTIGNIASEIKHSSDERAASRWKGVIDHLREQVKRNREVIEAARKVV